MRVFNTGNWYAGVERLKDHKGITKITQIFVTAKSNYLYGLKE